MERNAAEMTVQKEEQEIDLWELFLLYAAGGGRWWPLCS